MSLLDMKPLNQLVDLYYSAVKSGETQITDSLPEGDLQIIKDATGYKWLAVYTNSFRDEDLVPEIISSKSQKAFVGNVDAGKYEYPELQLWHNPKWKFGKATVVAFDEVEPGIVFGIAGGVIDKDKEYVAEALLASGVAWKNSHGMPTGEIVRSRGDGTIYDKHITTEITVLPPQYAANPLTGFGLLGEKGMIPDEKKAEIMGNLGVGKDVLLRLESSNKAATEVEKGSREYKEKNMDEQDVQTEVQPETVAAEVTEQVTEEVTTQTEETPDLPGFDPQAILDSNKELMTEITEIKGALDAVAGALETVGIAQKNLTERVDAVEKEKDDEVVAQTPTYSAAFKSRIDSIVGNPKAEVTEEKGKEETLTKGPEVTEPTAKSTQFGSTFLAGLVEKSQGL